MRPANDVHRLPDISSMRRSLQANAVKLLDAKDHLASQIAALRAVERQVRALALLESSRSLNAESNSAELQRLRELQVEMNVNFRQMQKTYVDLSVQIAGLLKQHEGLYEATFAQSVQVGDPI
jgi:hypothetical protein